MGNDLSDATGVLAGGTQTRVARDDQTGTIEVVWEGEKFPSGDDVIRVLNRMMWDNRVEPLTLAHINEILDEARVVDRGVVGVRRLATMVTDQEDSIDRLGKRLTEARHILQDIIDARTNSGISLPTKVSEAINKAYAFLALDRTPT